ncbi:BTB POZ domain-containing KCTD6 isoform X1 [Brachionus plicatilis]|uniref:BTB POZ domain-containing KCTD6 isoform X1 n=1 Tax=Brachionus plicatilis TaxID=10195 RepID=A0A3M7PWZ3_BRAPC|nr:BTB POZ domain-containing KCTD6 isoform X1 [Brachionus plicatilis]
MDALEINVGGRIFTTSLNTLTKYRDSIFAKMVNGSHPFGKDKNNLLFIDRSPDLFTYVLQYLRAEQLDVHKLMADQKAALFKALLTEAKFFNLNAFIFYLESMIRN